MASIPSSGSGGGSTPQSETDADVIVAVDAGTGSDAPTMSRAARLTGGDFSAEPFLTIQAAIDALPPIKRHNVTVDIAAGAYAGFEMRGGIIEGISSIFTAPQMTVQSPLITATLASGTVSGTIGVVGGDPFGTSFTVLGAGWAPDNLAGKYLAITAGVGAGAVLFITSNTVDTLETSGTAFSAPSDSFVIRECGAVISSAGPTPFTGVAIEAVKGSLSFSGIECSSLSAGFSIAHCDRVDFLNCTVDSASFIGWFIDNCGSVRLTDSGGNSASLEVEDTNRIELFGVGFAHLGSGSCKFFNVGTVGDLGSALNLRIEDISGTAIEAINSDLNLGLVRIDTVVRGFVTENCRAKISDLKIDNASTEPFNLNINTRFDILSSLDGSGNTGFGVKCAQSGCSFTFGAPFTVSFLPTITGTAGDFSLDGSTALTWATEIPSSGTSSFNSPTQSYVSRVTV